MVFGFRASEGCPGSTSGGAAHPGVTRAPMPRGLQPAVRPPLPCPQRQRPRGPGPPPPRPRPPPPQEPGRGLGAPSERRRAGQGQPCRGHPTGQPREARGSRKSGVNGQGQPTRLAVGSSREQAAKAAALSDSRVPARPCQLRPAGGGRPSGLSAPRVEAPADWRRERKNGAEGPARPGPVAQLHGVKCSHLETGFSTGPRTPLPVPGARLRARLGGREWACVGVRGQGRSRRPGAPGDAPAGQRGKG